MASDAESKSDLAALYTRVAPGYGQGTPMFAHAGRRLVELAGVSAGQRLLDIGAGRGAILFEAAERVGTRGRVTGIDIAPGMVDETSAEIARRGLRHAEIRLMDAEKRLDLPDATFDHVLCGFAVFFFENLSGVLREALRVLKPGGQIGFGFSRHIDPRWTWYAELLASSGALANLPRSPGGGQIRAAGALTSAMERAGFYAVEEVVEPAELWYRDADDWWNSLFTHGSVRPLERMTQERLAQFRTECLQRVRLQQDSRGVPETFEFVYALGRRD